jgi:predicted PurR-regulated permease PerM
MISSTPSKVSQWTFRRVMWATLVLVCVALSFWLLYRFYQVVFILYIAVVIGTVIRPVSSWFNRRGLSRTASVILVYLLLLALLVGFVLLLFPLIIDQGTTMVAAVPGYYHDLREWMVNYPNQWITRLSEFLPGALPGLAPIQQTVEQVMASAGQAMNYISTVIRALLISTAALLLAFYWTLSGSRIIQSLLLLIPSDRREGMSELISAMESKVGFYIAGQSVLCLVIGILALAAYLLIGLPNALVLALVAGVMEAVPMVGPLLGAIPASVIALSISPSKLIWVIVATVVIQQLENSVLVPRVMRRAVGVNPFVSLLAIFAFSSFFGIAGALMAIPTAAMIQLILDRVVFHPRVMEAEVSMERDYTSRVRYEAQSLAQDLRKQARLSKEGSELWVKQTDRVMDEIEAITTDLDSLLSQTNSPGAV